MSFRRLANEVLTWQKVGVSGTDAYGDEITGTVGVGVATFGYLEQTNSVEFNVDRSTSVSQWKVILWDVSLGIGHNDYLTFQGQQFQVNGEAWRVYNPRTKVVHHLECNAIAVVG
jgi:hypothetical protein